MNVTEDDNGDHEELDDLTEGQDHWYPKTRFNPELEFVDDRDREDDDQSGLGRLEEIHKSHLPGGNLQKENYADMSKN